MNELRRLLKRVGVQPYNLDWVEHEIASMFPPPPPKIVEVPVTVGEITVPPLRLAKQIGKHMLWNWQWDRIVDKASREARFLGAVKRALADCEKVES